MAVQRSLCLVRLVSVCVTVGITISITVVSGVWHDV